MDPGFNVASEWLMVMFGEITNKDLIYHTDKQRALRKFYHTDKQWAMRKFTRTSLFLY